MAWTSPKTWTAGEIVSASDMNLHIKDNETYLLSGRPGSAVYRDNGGSYSTTSSTFADIDGTNLKIDLSLSGSKILAGFEAVVTHSVANTATAFDLSVDGTLLGVAGADGLALYKSIGTADRLTVAFTALKTGLSSGTRTVKPQWRTGAATASLISGGGTTLNNDAMATLWAVEIG